MSAFKKLISNTELDKKGFKSLVSKILNKKLDRRAYTIEDIAYLVNKIYENEDMNFADKLQGLADTMDKDDKKKLLTVKSALMKQTKNELSMGDGWSTFFYCTGLLFWIPLVYNSVHASEKKVNERINSRYNLSNTENDGDKSKIKDKEH